MNKVFRAGYGLSLKVILLHDAFNIDISVNCDRLLIEENAWAIVTVSTNYLQKLPVFYSSSSLSSLESTITIASYFFAIAGSADAQLNLQRNGIELLLTIRHDYGELYNELVA